MRGGRGGRPGCNLCTSRHSIAPRFISWPENPSLVEGESLRLELHIENCNSVLLSRDFCPVSVLASGPEISLTSPHLILRPVWTDLSSSWSGRATAGPPRSGTSAPARPASTSSSPGTPTARRNIPSSSESDPEWTSALSRSVLLMTGQFTSYTYYLPISDIKTYICIYGPGWPP